MCNLSKLKRSSVADQRLLAAFDGANLAADGLDLLVESGVRRLESVELGASLLADVQRPLHVAQHVGMSQERAALIEVAVLTLQRHARPLHRHLSRPFLRRHGQHNTPTASRGLCILGVENHPLPFSVRFHKLTLYFSQFSVLTWPQWPLTHHFTPAISKFINEDLPSFN